MEIRKLRALEVEKGDLKMGCHTWFSRPIDEEDYKLLKEYAYEEALELEYDKDVCDRVKASVEDDKPCIYGRYWYECGFGSGNKKFIEKFGYNPYLKTIKGKLYWDMALPVEKIHSDDEELKKYFHDTFRIGHYPRKVIHNRRELRKFLGKKYFELSEEQLERVSEFFRMYKGGIITFG